MPKKPIRIIFIVIVQIILYLSLVRPLFNLLAKQNAIGIGFTWVNAVLLCSIVYLIMTIVYLIKMKRNGQILSIILFSGYAINSLINSILFIFDGKNFRYLLVPATLFCIIILMIYLLSNKKMNEYINTWNEYYKQKNQIKI